MKESESNSVVSNSLRPHGLSVEFSRLEYWTANPGIEPRSPTLQADSLPAEPQRKPKNTGVGSLPLQWEPPGSSVHGILQARILKHVDFPFFRGSFQAGD